MGGPILIVGAGGQVGRELAAASCEYPRLPLTRQQLDIIDARQVAAAFARHEPVIVINAAAYTQVDRAEQESELANAINRDGVANLADACMDAGIPLLHVSTDYVFDGSSQRAYRETDPVAPLGVYGASKAAGEAELRARLEKHLILRTSWVFSAHGNNFVKTMLRLGAEREELGIVDDQYGCPTSARSIAQALLGVAEAYLRGAKFAWGIYHFCNRPETSWYGFAREIFRQAGGYESLALRPIATSDFPTPARRPQNSVLDCSKYEAGFSTPRPAWHAELSQVLKQLGK